MFCSKLAGYMISPCCIPGSDTPFSRSLRFGLPIFGGKRQRLDFGQSTQERLTRSPVVPLSHPFFGGGFPYKNKLHKKVDTLILSSLLEDLVIVHSWFGLGAPLQSQPQHMAFICCHLLEVWPGCCLSFNRICWVISTVHFFVYVGKTKGKLKSDQI